MKDEDIEKLLRALPRQKASAEFTPRVLNKLARWSRVKAWYGARPVLAGVAALLLLGALAGALWRWSELRERTEAARRVEELRNEYESLERELQELRSLVATSQPVVELGGTEDVDILLDLRTLAVGSGQDREAQQQPVGYRR